jgi:zona occludens toxin
VAIELITGLPGNAKTLHALRLVIDRAAAENRPVFYAHMKQLVLDDPRLKGTSWTEIDATKWMDCPSGSLIFIDEAQKVFRSRSLGAIPPLHVTELEEHRHRGIDFVMLTQHPSLVDPAVRKLTQTHKHMVRIWGMEASTVHRWDAVRDNCDKPSARKDSEKVRWVFDKSLYGLYHSADQHTMKRQLPMRLKLLMLVPLILAASGWVVYQKLGHKPEPALVGAASPAPAGKARASLPAVGSASAAALPLAVTDPLADAKAYVAMRTPRVEGLPQTAPRYDQLTVPVRVPVPAMCVQIGDVRKRGGDVKCKCYSQQGTPMDVQFNMCIEFARNGYFQDFDADADRRGSERMASGQRVLEGRPEAPLPSTSSSSSSSSSSESGPMVLAMASVPSDAPSPAGRPPPAERDGRTATGRGKALPPPSMAQ